MLYRPIGKSGIEASVVGLGAWAIGGWMWGGTEESAAVATIHASLDHGVNLIDTAPVYGFGHSERVVGRAISDRRDKVVLATKCGLVTHTNGGERFFRSTSFGGDPNGLIGVFRNLSAVSIRWEVENSLMRLGTDYIDLLQTHWQESSTPISETMETLLDLKREGKIRAIGVSNASAAQMGEYEKIGQLDSDQEKYSMLDRDPEHNQLQYCRKHKLAFLAYSPLVLGLLSGTMAPDRVFGTGDLRAHAPRFSRDNIMAVNGKLAKLKYLADKHSVGLAQLVIAWTFYRDSVSHVLSGARNPTQAKANAAAGAVELEADELTAIDEVVAELPDPGEQH